MLTGIYRSMSVDQLEATYKELRGRVMRPRIVEGRKAQPQDVDCMIAARDALIQVRGFGRPYELNRGVDEALIVEAKRNRY